MEYKSLGDYFYYTDPIGQGSFSIIYRGYRVSDRKPVAIKKFTRYIDKRYIDSEISLMTDLDNNNVLKLYKVIKVKDSLFLILEYCNQGDLSKYIRSGNTQNDLNYVYQIINGLKYLYKSKILHRDIKPQNILINENIIKICDFGFAKSFKDNDLISTFCGSPLYMAPEILKFKEYTEKADIWSLGVIIYEILFKKHPYPSSNQQELIKNIKSDDNITVPNTIDPSLNFLITSMLNKSEIDRISWENLFKSKWFSNYTFENDYESIENDSFLSNESETIGSLEDSTESLNEIFKIDDILTSKEVRNKLYNNKTSFSINENAHRKSKNININYRSTIQHNNTATFEEYDDCKVYSRSAPNKSNLYVENYINKKFKDTINSVEEGYKIIGTSPNINDSGGVYNYLNKSVNTLKNLFNI